MKKRKNNILFLLIGLGFYAFSFIATSKQTIEDNPCNNALYNYWYKDTAAYHHYFNANAYSDTLIINADTSYNVNWNLKTDTLCKISKDSCANPVKVFLVINYKDTVRSHWDTRFGKKLFLKQCP